MLSWGGAPPRPEETPRAQLAPAVPSESLEKYYSSSSSKRLDGFCIYAQLEG